MKYYLHLGHTTAQKNILEKEALSFFKSIDGTLIEDGKLQSFKGYVRDTIEKLNVQNKRCKPLDVGFWSPAQKDTIYISGIHCLNISLYAVKKQF